MTFFEVCKRPLPVSLDTPPLQKFQSRARAGTRMKHGMEWSLGGPIGGLDHALRCPGMPCMHLIMPRMHAWCACASVQKPGFLRTSATPLWVAPTPHGHARTIQHAIGDVHAACHAPCMHVELAHGLCVPRARPGRGLLGGSGRERVSLLHALFSACRRMVLSIFMLHAMQKFCLAGSQDLSCRPCTTSALHTCLTLSDLEYV